MSLTRERVVAGALEILDAYGLADLTMRRLGDHLGVRASAVYWHVPNKQTLLARVADAIWAPLVHPSGRLARPGNGEDPTEPAATSPVAERALRFEAPLDPWRADLLAWATAAQQALLAHRDAAELVVAARASGLMEVDVAATPVSVLVDAGLDRPTAQACADAVVHLLLGSAAQEQARADWARFGDGTTAAPAPSDLAFGLGLLLDGIAVGLP